MLGQVLYLVVSILLWQPMQQVFHNAFILYKLLLDVSCWMTATGCLLLTSSPSTDTDGPSQNNLWIRLFLMLHIPSIERQHKVTLSQNK